MGSMLLLSEVSPLLKNCVLCQKAKGKLVFMKLWSFLWLHEEPSVAYSVLCLTGLGFITKMINELYTTNNILKEGGFSLMSP